MCSQSGPIEEASHGYMSQIRRIWLSYSEDVPEEKRATLPATVIVKVKPPFSPVHCVGSQEDSTGEPAN